MTQTQRIAYAPSSSQVHLWLVDKSGEKEYLFACDEVCHSGKCVGPDDFDEEREVSVRDMTVERVAGNVTVTFEGVVSESSSDE